MKSIKKKFRKGTAILLVCSMIVGLVTVMPQSVISVNAETPEGTPENPTHICTMQDDGTDTTEWSYVYFGSYPKSIVTDGQMIEAIEAKIAEIASEGSDYAGTKADTGTDVWVDGIKYRRITIRDVNSTENWLQNYVKYRYYKWERIKWRVLQNDGTNLFLMADEILDCQNYNSTSQNTMWRMSTIRTWLNSSFYHTAFNSGEQNAIISWNVENVNNPMTGLEAGGYTEDRIYLLSIAEAMNSIYGFCEKYDTYSVSRQLICSDYAYARGTYRADGDVKGWWWIRSPGADYGKAANVYRMGKIITDGEKVNSSNTGVAPVLHIKLSSDVWFMEDDGTSGEGGEDTVESTVTGYHGCYDGKAHGITVTVTDPADGKLTYSTDGIHYSEEAPQFVDVGTDTVYYKIQKDGYRTATGSDTVAITKRNITIAAEEQSVMFGNAIDQTKYTVLENGLADGDRISEITLTPSTTALTENGTITISNNTIANAAGEDVTGNYDIATVQATLKITHNTTLVPTKIEAEKTKTAYVAGDTLNVDDITVTAYYSDNFSETVTDFTTNASTIDMSVIGDKTLTVSYAKNGETVTKDITIHVSNAEEIISPEKEKQNSVKLDIHTVAGWKENKFVVKWDNVNDADGYDIFAARCGEKMTSKSLVKTVKGQKSSATLSKIAGKKLSGSQTYKVKIKAFQMVDGEKVYIGSSKIYHVAGKNSKTYTNAKKVKVSKKSVTIKKGETSRIKATIVKQSEKKKLLDKSHGPALRYDSTDTSVATVTAKGKIKAKDKGTCYIYVTALNGVKTKVKVTVK